MDIIIKNYQIYCCYILTKKNNPKAASLFPDTTPGLFSHIIVLLIQQFLYIFLICIQIDIQH